MKDNPITMGFDDSTFDFKDGSRKAQLIGVVCQGIRMVTVVKSEITIDGDDSTEKLIKLVKKNVKHVQFVLTHTITFGGFNLINLDVIYSQLKKPIIAITESEPDLDSVIRALENKFPNSYKDKIQTILNAGDLYETEIETAGGLSKIYFHSKGIAFTDVQSLLRKISIDSKLPECVRIAHLIGRLF
ncbi:MAG: DUF99 family protein [Promethearchaeota archaeon]